MRLLTANEATAPTSEHHMAHIGVSICVIFDQVRRLDVSSRARRHSAVLALFTKQRWQRARSRQAPIDWLEWQNRKHAGMRTRRFFREKGRQTNRQAESHRKYESK